MNCLSNRLSLVALWAGCVAPAFARSPQELEVGVPWVRAFDVTSADGPQAVGELEVSSPAAGRLHFACESPTHDLSLEVLGADASLAGADEDSGGGTNPYLSVEARAGQLFIVLLRARGPVGSGSLAMKVELSRELPAVRTAVQQARADMRGLEGPQGGAEFEAVRAELANVLDQVLGVEGWRESFELADLLYAIGNRAYRTEGPELAVRAWGASRELLERCVPETHPELQSVRTNLALGLRLCRRYSEALELNTRTVEIYNSSVEPSDYSLLMTRTNRAGDLHSLGRYAEARRIAEEVLLLLREHPVRGQSLRDQAEYILADTLAVLGDLQAAAQIGEGVLARMIERYGADHPTVYGHYVSQGAILQQLGQLQRSRALLERAYHGYSEVLDDHHMELQRARAYLALSVRELGDLETARQLMEKVLQVLSETGDPNGVLLVATRINYASTLKDLGLMSEALRIEESLLENLGETHFAQSPEAPLLHLNYVQSLFELGEDGRAFEVLKVVRERMSRELPVHHVNRLGAESIYSRVLKRRGDHAAAEEVLRSVLELAEARLPVYSRIRNDARSDLVWLLIRQGRFTEAKRAATVLSRQMVEAMTLLAYALSPRELQAFVSDLDVSMSTTLQIAGLPADETAGDVDAELLNASWELVETLRDVAFLSASVSQLAQQDEETHALRSRLRESAEALVELSNRDVDAETFASALLLRDQALRELLEHTRAVTSQQAPELTVQLETIRGHLAADEVLVSFWQYEGDIDGSSESLDDPRVAKLMAWVLQPDGALERVELGSAAVIAAAISKWRGAMSVAPGSSRGVQAAKPAAEDRKAAGCALRQLIWSPLQSLLAGASRVVVVPDGVLHTVPFDALPLEDDARIGDRQRIHTVGSVRQIAHRASHSSATATVVVVAGVDYGAAGRFPALDATVAELEAVEAAFSDDEDWTVVRLTGEGATPDRVRAAASRARVLHLATHGFFEPAPLSGGSLPRSESELVPSDSAARVRGLSPFALCGLAFAGANEDPDQLGRRRGVVTAEEMAAWDLSQCELAVLSACETNVGVVRAGQGVASLQKALHMAGAKVVLSSLWPVSDEATKDLMTDFYRLHWEESKPIDEALWEAKLALRTRGAAVRDWAGWVVSGR